MKTKKEMTIKLLNYLGIDEPTEIQIKKLSCFCYKEIARPLVVQDRHRGLSLQQLSTKYYLTIRQVRTIVDNYNMTKIDT